MNVLNFFIPGYIFIELFLWTSHKTINSFTEITLLSCVISYIINVISFQIENSCMFFSDKKIIILLIISVISGILLGEIVSCKKISVLLGKHFHNTAISILLDLFNLSDGYIVIIHLHKDVYMIGKLKYFIDKGNFPSIYLVSYKIYDKQTRKEIKDGNSCGLDGALVKLDDIEYIEIDK